VIRILILGVALASAAIALAVAAFETPRPLTSLGLLLPVLGPVAILGIFATRSPWLKLFAMAGAFWSFATIGPAFIPQVPGEDVRVYSKNLAAGNGRIAALVEDIRSAGVDLVMLQELSDANRRILKRLEDDFPHQHVCTYSRWSGIAILSKVPFDGAPRCTEGRVLAAAPVIVSETRVWAVSAHIPWPWPRPTGPHEAEARAFLSDLDAPVVLAGDFNSFPWVARVRGFAAPNRLKAAGPARATFSFKGIPLPIDLAFAPGGGRLERRPEMGSDHAGIVADLSLIPR